MSTDDHPGDAPAASAIADRLRDAEFVRFVATPDGDALAAVGLLARARDGPFQASVSRTVGGGEADLTVGVGLRGGDLALTDEPLSLTANAVAAEFDAPDPALALVGIAAAGMDPSRYDLAEYAAVERAAGVARPTDDVTDALAHTTLAHASFSGDSEAAASAVAGCEADDPRTLASLLALSTVEGASGCPRAAESVRRALRPHTMGDSGPFATVEGYADVLDCVAREAPGTGVALALGYADESSGLREAALSAWRSHARTAHSVVSEATLTRHRGLVVVETSGSGTPLETVARIVRDYRSPEAVVCVSDDAHVAVAGTENVLGQVRTAAETVGSTTSGRGRTAVADVRADEREAFIERVRAEVAS